jgi:hypothetical protein
MNNSTMPKVEEFKITDTKGIKNKRIKEDEGEKIIQGLRKRLTPTGHKKDSNRVKTKEEIVGKVKLTIVGARKNRPPDIGSPKSPVRGKCKRNNSASEEHNLRKRELKIKRENTNCNRKEPYDKTQIEKWFQTTHANKKPPENTNQKEKDKVNTGIQEIQATEGIIGKVTEPKVNYTENRNQEQNNNKPKEGTTNKTPNKEEQHELN